MIVDSDNRQNGRPAAVIGDGTAAAPIMTAIGQ